MRVETRESNATNCWGCDAVDAPLGLVMAVGEPSQARRNALPALCRACARVLGREILEAAEPTLTVGCEVELCTQEPREAIWKLMSGSRLVEDQGSHRVFRTADGEYRRVAHFMLRAAVPA